MTAATQPPTEPDARRVRDLMTREVVTLGRADKLVTADDVMRLGRIRHLPVLDERGQLVGIVTQTDLYRGAVLRALGFAAQDDRSLLHGLSVSDAMTEQVHTTAPDAPLREAAQTMLRHKLGCLVVVEGRKVVGILTESDFVKPFAQ
jgi:CBS domain-containing membrane protein